MSCATAITCPGAASAQGKAQVRGLQSLARHHDAQHRGLPWGTFADHHYVVRKHGKVVFADLAGSERVKETGATEGKQLKEATNVRSNKTVAFHPLER